MRLKTITLITILTSTILVFGCGGSETATNTANTANIESNSNSQSPLATTKTPEIATTNEAPTFTPIVKAYCEAIIKKDDAGLRKVHSQDTLKIFDEDMKSENKTSLAEFLGELDPLKDVTKCGARNEKIDGDKGYAIIRTERMPDGISLEFIKENGAWKLTNKSPDVKSVKESATNSAK